MDPTAHWTECNNEVKTRIHRDRKERKTAHTRSLRSSIMINFGLLRKQWIAASTSFSSLEELMNFTWIFSNSSTDQKAAFSSSCRTGKGNAFLNLDSNPTINTLHPLSSAYSRANCHAKLVFPDDFGPNRIRLTIHRVEYRKNERLWESKL